MLFYSCELILGPYGHESTLLAVPANHHRLIWTIIVYTVLVRLFYSGPMELLHEEGYYWLYAQFLDIGYLDHPPMVAWLIRAFTTALGQSEFTIRFSAFLCWLITAYYMYRLTDRIAGPAAALRALLLVALLPAFFCHWHGHASRRPPDGLLGRGFVLSLPRADR